MSALSDLNDKIKTMGSAIAGIFGIVASIGGAIIYVENNYAHAEDIKEVVKNQSIQIKQNLLFQLDFYDDRIKKLELEKSKNEEILSDPAAPRSLRAYTRKPADILAEINELKKRREDLQKNFIVPPSK